MLEGFHLRVAQIVGASTGPEGFALGGGYGLQVHEITNRPSKDVDVYVDSMDPDVFIRAEHALVSTLRESGIAASVVQHGDWFRAIVARDPETGEEVSIDIGYDYRSSPPVTVTGVGPVLGLDDLVLGKVRAFVDRAAERDYYDVDALLQDGRWSPRELHQIVSPIRPDVSAEAFGDLLRSAHRGDPEVYAGLGLRVKDQLAMFGRLASAADMGDVYVSAHARNGNPVRAYWRSRPTS